MSVAEIEAWRVENSVWETGRLHLAFGRYDTTGVWVGSDLAIANRVNKFLGTGQGAIYLSYYCIKA